MRISIVIPVYNSARTIGKLVARLEARLGGICENYELILVNDGSVDQSWRKIKALVQVSDRITGVDLMKNYGQHNALLCGIRMARYEYIITMDDDLQHPPEEIDKLVRKIEEGYDVVYGAEIDRNHSTIRKICSSLAKLLLSFALSDSSTRQIGSFRIFRSSLRESFESYNGSTVCIDALLNWASGSSAFVEVEHAPRTTGKSNYGFSGLLGHAVNNFLAFDALPLKLTSLLGVFFAIAGAVTLLFVLGNYLVHGSVVPGFAFLVSIISIFSGVQLFSIGMLGEYISRIHTGVMRKPSYSVRYCLRSNHTELSIS